MIDRVSEMLVRLAARVGWAKKIGPKIIASIAKIPTKELVFVYFFIFVFMKFKTNYSFFELCITIIPWILKKSNNSYIRGQVSKLSRNNIR